MIAAVFDVDRTLLPETTAERIFLSYLIHERVVGLRSLLETIRFMAVEGRSSPIKETRRHRPYLRDAHVAQITELRGVAVSKSVFGLACQCRASSVSRLISATDTSRYFSQDPSRRSSSRWRVRSASSTCSAVGWKSAMIALPAG